MYILNYYIILVLLSQLYIPQLLCKTEQIRLVIKKQILPGYSKKQVTVNGTGSHKLFIIY